MPYWKIGEKKFDVDGKEINIGDLLQSIMPSPYPWQYYVCFSHDGKTIEVRDLNNNNVCMCNVADSIEKKESSDVKNIGHYSKHSAVFDASEEEFYFKKEVYNEEENKYFFEFFPWARRVD